MARKKNRVETVEVRIRTTSQVASYLDGLAATGLFGKTRAEAAERLITRGIEAALQQGLVKADTPSEGK